MIPNINQLKINRLHTRYQTLQFTADLVGNKYVFNDEKILYNALPNALYIFDKMSFGASVAQENFTAALVDAISLNVRRDSTKTNINNSPFDIAQFWGNYELGLPFKGADNFATTGEPISIKVNGILNQTAEFVSLGVSQIKLSFTFKIYEIQDSNFIANNWDS